MPARRNKRPSSQPHVKLPKDVVPLQKFTGIDPAKKDISKDVEQLCDLLMETEWLPWIARPRGDLVGYLVIAKWYPKLKSWALLYVTRGHIGPQLNKVFSGRWAAPISRYLSSFSKADRALVWIKWIKDPAYPFEVFVSGRSKRGCRETAPLEDVVEGLGTFYNEGERPAFNLTDADLKPEIPDNFSILDYA